MATRALYLHGLRRSLPGMHRMPIALMFSRSTTRSTRPSPQRLQPVIALPEVMA